MLKSEDPIRKIGSWNEQYMVALLVVCVACGIPVACAVTNDPEVATKAMTTLNSFLTLAHESPEMNVTMNRSAEESVFAMTLAISLATLLGMRWRAGSGLRGSRHRHQRRH